MNYFKVLIGAFKKLIHAELYSSPELAVALYRKKGVVIGENTELYNTDIDNRRPFLVEIGNNTIITGSIILTHDASTKKAFGYTKLGKVIIGDNVFIGMNCVILPNVTIGNNVIVGAGTIVSKNIPDNSVVVGSPMKIIGTLKDNIKKNTEKLNSSHIFELNYNMSAEEKEDMKMKLSNSCIGYIPMHKELERLNNKI